MRALVIGPEQEALIAALRSKARANVVPFEAMKLRAAGNVRNIAEINSDYTMGIPFGFSVTLTHEEHRPGIVCRHLSVSVDRAGKGPHPLAVQEIMSKFGFANPLGELVCWDEPLDQDRFAINVVEPLDGDMSRLGKRA